MVVIRPVTLNDLDPLLELATLTGFGLTTLPRDRDLLTRRIRESLRGFEKVEDDRPAGECYLFVMEELRNGRIVGTCGVVSKVGGFEPFYAYKVETTVHESEMLNVRKEIQTLHLVTEHNGPCEIGSLFLHPEYRRGGNGRLLSQSRFLFIAEHAAFFDPVVIAEMRGVIDDQGRSAFWDAIGKHFFEIDFPKADYLSIVNKKFIADLMPRHPIYVPLLPAEAQAVIGHVHPQTEPALKILQSEGFAFSGMVDIFEAGPIVRCRRDEIRTVRMSRRAKVEEIVDHELKAEECVVGSTRRDFRACKASVETTPGGAPGSGGDSGGTSGGGVRITSATALALQVKVGDHVRTVPLRSSGPAGESAAAPASPAPGGQ
jgi:arginine N-succinyltransferase